MNRKVAMGELADWTEGRRRPVHRVLAVVSGFGVVAVVLAASTSAAYTTPIPPIAAMLYVLGGLLDAWRRPMNVTGWVLIAAGWFHAIGPLSRVGIPSVAIPAVAVANAPEVLGAFVLLTFPTGRFVSRLDRFVWLAALGVFLVDALTILILADPALSSIPDQPHRLPVDQVGSPTYRAVYPVTVAAAALLGVLVGVCLVRRWLMALGPTRWILRPILAAGMLGIGSFVGGQAAALAAGTAQVALLISARLMTGALPAAFLVGVWRLGIDRTAVVGLIELLSETSGTWVLNERIRRVLHDPTAEVLTWSAERGAWLDDEGREIDDPGHHGQAWTPVERGGRLLGAIVHHPSLSGADALLAPLRAALALALGTSPPGGRERPSALEPGEMLGPYRIEGVLGRGGMGTVYRAMDTELRRPIALKVLNPGIADDPAARRRFVREARTVAALEHAGIVPVYAAGETRDVPWIASRWIEGTDLEALIRSGVPLTVERAIEITAAVAAALDFAAERGFVHRDVKPANILISGESGQAFLADFGLTRELLEGPATATQLTETAGLLGTIDYVSPEQIRGERVGPAADVYSLAGVMFTCLAGQPPFRRDTALATLWAHLHEPAPSLSDYRSDVPAEFAEAVQRGLAKEPADRYPSAGALVAAVREAARSARPEGAPR